jgi:hypothetical protein
MRFSDEVIPDNDDHDAGRADVLLSASKNQAELRKIVRQSFYISMMGASSLDRKYGLPISHPSDYRCAD